MEPGPFIQLSRAQECLIRELIWSILTRPEQLWTWTWTLCAGLQVKSLRPGTASNFPDIPSGKLPWGVEDLVEGWIGCGMLVGTGIKALAVFRAQLTGSWPWTRPGEKDRILALWQVTQLAELMVLLWETVGVYFSRKKPWDTEIKTSIWQSLCQIHAEFCQWQWWQIWPQHFKKESTIKQLRWGWGGKIWCSNLVRLKR